MVRSLSRDSRFTPTGLADAETIGGVDHAVLCVDCVDCPGASFRVIPTEIWGHENNLRLSNMDFTEFASAAGPADVFRGFLV
ncbi:DUF6924 domain-containing protein [Flavobacterium sp.]|jgi:hypothetical protein|uniref:DUF6924 domain-containing protein n=1 Tax=Flavobacterium sp. TaxID=239 RepID=UPI0037C07EDE